MSRMLLLAAALFLSQTLKAELDVGDPAPPLKISKWAKGKPVNLADGKDKNIYVVEFWATWCGPCIQSIPHLTKIAEHFAKHNVTIIGVSIDDEKTVANVEPFIQKMGKKMGYTVAIDDKEATNKAYLEAAGAEGIPHAFIIGKDGKIAWHGHPIGENMDLKLAQIVGDKEYTEKAEKILKERKNFESFAQDEKWDEAIGAIEKLMALEPDQSFLPYLKYKLLILGKKDSAAASKWGREAVQKTDNAETLNQMAWEILTDEEFEEKRDLPLALAAAKKANELSEAKDWSILDTYARALFDTGSVKEAIEIQKKSVAIGKQEKIREDALEEIEQSLARYEKAAGGDAKGGDKGGEKDSDKGGKEKDAKGDAGK